MDYDILPDCQIENLNEIYLKCFGYKTDGVFVEVGGYDGRSFSNTWGLAVAGWHGTYIEPVVEYAGLCAKNHADHHVDVVQSAVGDYTGIVTMHFAGALTTYDPFYLQSKTWGSYYNPESTFEVQIDTLDNILNSLHHPDGFDLLVIDVEGAEMKVINGFNYTYWNPKMIIVEEHEQNEHQELARLVPEIESRLSPYYDKIYSGWVNSIYLRK